MKSILRNGTIILPDKTIVADISIDEGRITKIEPNICDEADEYIDVTGKLILAGAIDSHTHFDLDVGVTQTADDFYTGQKQQWQVEQQPLLILLHRQKVIL